MMATARIRHDRVPPGSRIYSGLLTGVAGLVLGMPGVVLAEDIAPFRLTGIEGYTSLRYLYDAQSLGAVTTGAKTTDSLSSLQEEVFINTHSYFYHPNFLKMDLGGGPLWVQNRAESAGVGNESNDTLYNLTGRLSFLEQKPYPLAIYYDHLNSTVSTSLTESFNQTNTKYGSTFSLREPLSPVQFTADVFRQRSEGQSLDRIVSDDIEQATARLYSTLGPDGYGQLQYLSSRQESMSGNPTLPIVPTTVETHNANFDSRLLFGANRQFTNTNIIGYSSQSYVHPDTTLAREDFRFSPDLRWQHSETLTSLYRYNLFKSSEAMLDTTNQSARLGLNHQYAERLFTTFDLHGEDNRITGLTLRSYGADALVSYRRPFSIGSVQLSAHAIYDQKDREASVALINVFSERITLADAIPMTLTQDFIDTTTIRVFNLTRSQEYSTVADYRIIVIGSRTQIQRLATGTILDGEEVLVDYAFRTGGTAGYNLFDQSYQASLTLYRYYTAYARYRDAAYRLTSGAPTLPLNSVQNTLYGLRVDQPLWQDFMLGGEAMFEHQEEDISPYRRESYDAYVQTPLLFHSTSRLSARRVTVDYVNSPEDVNLTGWALQLRSSPWAYTTLSAEANYEEDSGGTLLRRYWRQTLTAEWRFRKLIVRGEGQYAREIQGDYERERIVIRAIVRRDF